MNCSFKCWQVPVFSLGAAALLVGCSGSASEGDGLNDSPAAVLSWTAPKTRMDGTGLKVGEIDHYVIRYGRDANELADQVTVGGDATSYAFEHLEKGVWYFTIQTKDHVGLISVPSAPVRKSVRS